MSDAEIALWVQSRAIFRDRCVDLANDLSDCESTEQFNRLLNTAESLAGFFWPQVEATTMEILRARVGRRPRPVDHWLEAR